MIKSSSQIRQEFLDFFKEKGHKIVPSASVVPYNDPTLLFTNAGMNQFKDVFIGTGTRDYKRCADTQKCIRVSGKHNDLEEVGHDGYHHTFFEMLGNWSFGDYYKKEAIKWAWELFTEVWELPKKKLWATVYTTDDEAYNYWKSETDIDPSHILRFGEKDNFWEMGETGPCGPCSEIHIDLTESGCKPEDINEGKVEVELWNLVFIQYNRDAEGKLHELPMKHVDTGMGFERIVSILQNKKSNYETDCFLPLIDELINITGKDYLGEKYISSMNVIADHIRALTFAIGDGAIPSNEGRGYVLRRILRRAARYGRNLGMRKPFIYKLVDVLIDKMGNMFPEIIEKHKFIKEVVQSEEESFNETLDRGLVFLNEEIEKMKNENKKIFSGEVAFKLHDTYGFPVDLTQLMAREFGYDVDMDKFYSLMEQARGLSRIEKIMDIVDENSYDELNIQNKGLKYDPYNIKDEIETQILKFENRFINRTGVLLSINPFYKQSGGQIGDSGFLIINNKQYKVLYVCNENVIEIEEINDIQLPIKATAIINLNKRLSIQRNHSATHLVHEALRQVLGPHVKQMGSYLDDKLLRFDFPHFHKVTVEEIKNIEDIVNEKIAQNIGVNWEIMAIEKAEKIPHVKKFFGEKYGDEVRVVFIDEKFSVEFCGGTHVKDTSDIGLFKIVKEESISSGVRRIFARTGEGIIQLLDERVNDIEKLLSELPEKYSSNFKKGIGEFKSNYKSIDFRDTAILSKLIQYQDLTYSSLIDLREKFLEEKKKTEKEIAKQNTLNVITSLSEILSKGYKLNGFDVVTAKIDVKSMDELKEVGDILREKIGTGVGLLYSIFEGKVNIVTIVSDNLIRDKGLNAGKLSKDFASLLGGGGGGKPHLATAGGKNIEKLDYALSQLNNIITKYLK